MEQVWIPRPGPPEVLELREAPDPEPGPGELRIRVRAAGVNFADLMARLGLYPDAPPLPAVVGYEVAGEVDALGPGVPAARLGEKVVAVTRFGGYSSRVVVPAGHALPLPPGLDPEPAAALPVNGLTAWMLLEEMGRVRTGDRVLLHSAAGGVGLVALDLCRWRGAEVTGLASPGKHAFLRERGCTRVLSSRGDWASALRGGESFDLVLDPVGGRSWRQGLDLLRPGGRLLCYGFAGAVGGPRRSVLRALRHLLAVPWRRCHPVSLMNRNQGVMGVNLGRLWGEGERLRAWLGRLLELAALGVVRPHIHARVPFAEAARAHRILHARENTGKVLLVPGSPQERAGGGR